MALTHNLSGDQGSTFTKAFQWLRDNAPVPLIEEAWNAHLQVRAGPGEPVLLEAKSEGGEGISLTDQGDIVLTFTSAQMGAIEAGAYRYDLDLYQANTNRKTLLKGSFTVFPEITKEA